MLGCNVELEGFKKRTTRLVNGIPSTRYLSRDAQIEECRGQGKVLGMTARSEFKDQKANGNIEKSLD